VVSYVCRVRYRRRERKEKGEWGFRQVLARDLTQTQEHSPSETSVVETDLVWDALKCREGVSVGWKSHPKMFGTRDPFPGETAPMIFSPRPIEIVAFLPSLDLFRELIRFREEVPPFETRGGRTKELRPFCRFPFSLGPREAIQPSPYISCEQKS
jgi:hypothetical protein